MTLITTSRTRLDVSIIDCGVTGWSTVRIALEREDSLCRVYICLDDEVEFAKCFTVGRVIPLSRPFQIFRGEVNGYLADSFGTTTLRIVWRLVKATAI